MPESLGKGSGPDLLIRAVVFALGIAAQAVGTYVGLPNLPSIPGLPVTTGQPLIGLLIASIGCGMAAAVLLMVAAKQRERIVVLVLSEGERSLIAPKYRPGRRTASVLGLLVILGAFGWYAQWAVEALRRPVFAQLVEFDAYPRRYLNNALVEPEYRRRLSRFTTRRGRIWDEDRLDDGRIYPTAAALTRRSGFYGPTTFDDEIFALEFELRAHPEHSPVQVEAIRIIVDSFEPLPLYRDLARAAPDTSSAPFHMYHVILGKPSSEASLKVLASFVAADDTESGGSCNALCLRLQDGGAALLTDEQVTSFLVKVDAPEPGFYGFDVEIFLSSGGQLQRFGIASFTHVLFY